MKEGLILVITIFFLNVGHQRVSAQELRGVDHWQTIFDKIELKKKSEIVLLSRTDDSWTYYKLSYYLDAYNKMFQVTQDKKYIDTFFELTENLIDQAKISHSLTNSQFKDGYLGWVDKSSSIKQNHGKEYPLYESYCWRYITDMLLFLCRNEELLQELNYVNRYNDILEFTEKNIFEKWYTRGIGHLYRSNTHMFSHWARICFDLHKITGKDIYEGVFKEFNTRMEKKISLSKNAPKTIIPFTSFWNRKNNVILDTSHANATIGALIKMNEESEFYSDDTIEGFVNLFDNVIWKNKKQYAKLINGSGKGTGWFTDGWMKLGRFDRDLQKRLESHTIGRSIQFYANLCYNAHYFDN